MKKAIDYDKEHALISLLVAEGDVAMRRILKERIHPEFFTDIERREQYVWLLNKYQKKGRVPSHSLFAAAHPDFEMLEVRDNLPLIIDAVREKKAYNDVQSILSKVNREAKSDINEALRLLKEETALLTQRHSSGERRDLTKSGESILLAYKQNKTMKGMHGVPYLWPRANKAARGKANGQFIGVYGATGSYKTFLLIADAQHSHRVWGRIPAFVTREMLPEEIEERWAVIDAKVSYEDYQNGTLSEVDERRLKLAIEEMKDCHPFHVTTITGYGASAVAEMRATVQETGAELLYVDGAYFYSENGDYRSFMTVCNGLKDTALELKIPVVASNQANMKPSRDGMGETGDVGSGQSFAQAADVLVRTFCEPENEENEELVLKLKKVRKGKRCTFTINCKPGGNFTQKYDDEDQEALEATIDDTDGKLQ